MYVNSSVIVDFSGNKINFQVPNSLINPELISQICPCSCSPLLNARLYIFFTTDLHIVPFESILVFHRQCKETTVSEPLNLPTNAWL